MSLMCAARMVFPFASVISRSMTSMRPTRLLSPETLAAHENDWRAVARTLTGPVPGGRSIFYQKHMTHHMLPEFGLGWIKECRNAFLIRAPEAVLASYSARRAEFLPDDVGFARQQ